MAENSPIIPTETDIKDQNLLLRFLRKIGSRIGDASDRIGKLERAPKPPSIQDIRNSLQVGGATPLNLQGLPGVTQNPQLAGTPRVSTVPSGLILQQYQDQQLVLVGNTSTGFSLYTVVQGNPTTLYQLAGGLTTNTVNVTNTKLQSFELIIRNSSSQIQHSISAYGQATGTGNWADKITGAAATFTATPYLGTTSSFAAGVGIWSSQPYRLTLDTLTSQSITDLVACASVAFDNRSLSTGGLLPQPNIISSNVNGITMNRLEIWLSDETGAAIAVTNTSTGAVGVPIPLGKTFSIRFMGYMY